MRKYDEDKARVELGMTCVCKEDGQKAAKEVRDKVDALMEIEPDDPYFVTWAVHQLNWEYDSHINLMASDMWCGLQVESPDERIYIQCDRIEDGLAEIILYLQDKKESEDEIVSPTPVQSD